MTTSTAPMDTMREFYAAIQSKDVPALTAILDASFAEDVVVHIPTSLYYGGTYRGRETLKKLFAGLVHPKSAIDATTFKVDAMIGTDKDVAVELSFAWRGRGGGDPLLTGNLEWITFDEGRVTSIRAFYRDTAECKAVDDASRAANTP